VEIFEAGISFIIIHKRPDFMKKESFSFNLFTVVNIITANDSILRFPLSGYYVDSRGLCSVPKDESSHTGYQTATYHASARRGR